MYRLSMCYCLFVAGIGLWCAQDLLVVGQPRPIDPIVDAPANQLSASGFVGYKRCCPCGTSFSLKRLGCVSYNNKLSECFGTDAANPCEDAADGDRVPRSDPFSVSPNAKHCVGFNTCENLNGDVVPNPTCCPTGTCFDSLTGQCTSSACLNSPSCSSLTQKEIEANCNCDHTEAPKTECFFMPVSGTDNQFMGVENMRTYTCSSGSCWDQSVCACVPADITANDQCIEFLHINFTDEMFDPVTGLGHEVWAIENEINFTQEGAVFEAESSINVAGLAGMHLGRTAVFHVRFTLNSGFPGQDECLFGNCLPTDTNLGLSETIVVLLTRPLVLLPGDSPALVVISIRYQRTTSNTGNNEGMLVLADRIGLLNIGQEYDFWLIISGDDDVAAFRVFDENDNLVSSFVREIVDLESLIMEQSGFVFGSCPSAQRDFQGIISLVEFYNCKPDTPEFLEVFGDLDARRKLP